MSKFFEDVGDFITGPVRTVYGIATGNPKYNSPGDIWNRSVGPGNAFQNVVSDLPGVSLSKKIGLGDASKLFETPTWDEMGKPLQAFSSHIDTANKALPNAFQPYAVPLETAVLSAFNPFAGAAFSTAYNAGQNQAQPGGFDWGSFGKDAAINFGTAGISAGANKLIQGANAAAATKQAAGTLSDFNTALGTGSSANLATVNAARNSTQGALSAFNTPGAIAGASTSLVPKAQSVQSSGIGDAAYKGSIKAAENLGNAALTDTLAPKQNQPIGALDAFGTSTDAGGSGSLPWGDVLNAFGGAEINTPNPNGVRIDSNAFNAMVDRLGANSYLQQSQARDTALPAGQYQAPQNSPYANRLSEINKGTTQSYADLLDQVNNANSYYGIIDANPGLTTDQLDKYLADPSTGILGNFRVPDANRDYFQGIRPLGPQNMSLL